jgi:uncharacterized protein (TIGR02444 family)
MSFPVHPFWDFSLSFYRQPGVADACLFVQDRYGLNINIVLFCVWVANSGGGALTTAHIATALRRIADWEGHVIKPLREIRRACRREALGVPEFLLQMFQPQIETVELEAEHVEQLVLAELVLSLEFSAEEGDDPASDAVRSLKAYVDELDVVQDAQLTECLSTILHAAFAGTQFPGAGEDP